MEEDLKAVLKENARLADELVRNGVKISVDLNIIPIIIKYGTFSPKRLENWKYEALQDLALKDDAFFSSLCTSLLTLARKDLQSSVTINEKKAVSVLLAGKERAPLLIAALLKTAAIEAPRFFFTAREYLQSESEWLQADIKITFPFPEIRQFGPKFSEKYPLCAEFIANPSSEPVKLMLDDVHRIEELKFIVSLAVYHFDQKWLYENILQPAWESKNAETSKIVLEALSKNPSFSDFCTDKLKQ